MAWHYGTYNCGHEGRTNIIGKTKDREWKADKHFSGLCPECWEVEKQRQFDEANAKAAAEAAEMDLPELTGTERQVSWANTLRQAWIKTADGYVENGKTNIKKFKETDPDKAIEVEKELAIVMTAIDNILKAKTAARYWIDSRDSDVSTTIKDEIKKIETEQAQPLVPEAVKQEVMDTLTMRPSESVTDLVTEIRIKEDFVTAKLPEKNEAFRSIVRFLNFAWENGCWQRKTSESTGTAMDRATELGIKLLAAGFPIRVFDDILQQQILAGQYEPESDRWIYVYENGFRIKWFNRSEDFYQEAKRLPGSRWISEKRSMYVPAEAFRDLQGFADRYKFTFSAKAKERLEIAKQAFESAMVADVTVPQNEQLPQPGSVPVLKVEEGKIHADLCDEN